MKRLLSLMLVLLLLFSAGCKQQDAEPADPGEVVEKTETGTSEADLPEVVEQEEVPPVEEKKEIEEVAPSEAGQSKPSTEEEKAARLDEALMQAEKIYAQEKDVEPVDFFVCKYLVRIKDESLGREYTTSSFSEIDCSQIEIFSRTPGAQGSLPQSYVLITKTYDFSKIFTWKKTLLERSDLSQAYLMSYTVYQVAETVENPEHPSLQVPPSSLGSTLQLTVERKFYPNYLVSIKDFKDYEIESMEVSKFDSEEFFYIDLYVKTTDQDDLDTIISSLQKREDIIKVSMLTGFDYPEEKEA